jgi:hypothetical protein
MGEVEVPDADEHGWRPAAATLAQGMRAMVLRHPWITGCFGDRANNGPKALGLAERTMLVMQHAGFTGMDTAYACSVLVNHAIGAAIAEAAWRQALARSGMTEEELTASILSYQDSVAADYPATARWMKETAPLDVGRMQREGFAFGLERVLDGLEAWLGSGQQAPTAVDQQPLTGEEAGRLRSEEADRVGDVGGAAEVS